MSTEQEQQQQQMASMWKSGRVGTLTPWSQAKVWALTVAWSELHPETTHGRNTWIASKVYVVQDPGRDGQTGKKRKGQSVGNEHPSEQAIGKLIKKMEEDTEWFPGKFYGSLGGRPSALSETNKAIIARSAMALKEKGIPPTGPLVLAQCPAAATNPNTGEPVAFQRLYDIFETKCYDNDPDVPWEHRKRLCQNALSPPMIEKRLLFGKYMEKLHQDKGWSVERYFQKVIWTDMCNDVLPRSLAKAIAQAQARQGGSAWYSQDCATNSENLRGKKEELKLAGSGTVRLHWMPVLTMGKLHVEILGSGFAADRPESMATFLQKLRAAINRRFQDGASQPTTLFVDRGNGFYESGSGIITPEFNSALQENDFRAFHGVNASIQPGQSGDLMLHETAVAWIRLRMAQTLPREPWRESEEEWGKRLKDTVTYINNKYDVEGLCREMPERMRILVHEKQGDRVGK